MKGKLTLCIIKPVAVSKKFSGAILQKIEDSGYTICGLKMTKLNKKKAGEFYKIHKGKTFYEGLTDYMSSGHIIVLVLYKSNAVADFRKLIGSTNPEEADTNTIRKLFGTSLQKNAVHGSDSDENAQSEINFFFSPNELFFTDIERFNVFL